MHIIQVSPRFSGQPVRGRRRKLPWRPGIARRRAAAGDHHDPPGLFAEHLRASRHITIAEALLRAEGFTDVRYVCRKAASADAAIATRRARFRLRASRLGSSFVDAGVPITVLAGMHSGCYELFAHEPIRTHHRLEGQERRHPDSHARARTCTCRSWRRMSASIPQGHRMGHEPCGNAHGSVRRGEIDAFLAFPPEPQELRARKIGRVSSTRPWIGLGRTTSAACCPASRVRARLSGRHQARSAGRAQGRRSLRRRAGTAARQLVDGGFTESYDYALQTLTEVPYDSGASSTRRTRCASTRCACTRSA